MNEPKKFTLKEVTDQASIKLFLDFPAKLYAADKNWIRPLNEDIEKVFDPSKNKLFRKGNAIRWILLNEKNETIGRIAAFYDNSARSKYDQPTGGCGFFDCIEDQSAANKMFDACIGWLKQNDFEAMDGPINFGSRDAFWGCLYDGFYEPIYNMPYNYSYYNDLFVKFGFKTLYNQYTYHVPLTGGTLEPEVHEKASRLYQDPNYKFESVNLNRLKKYADDFTIIFNNAWAKFPGVIKFRPAQSLKMFKKLKLLVDPKAVIFGYYKDEPIGFFIMIPDLYQITRKFKGKFNLLNKLRLLFAIKVRRSYTRLIGVIFGVVPEFHGKGVAAGMVMHYENEIIKPGFRYKDLEMNWIGDFNPVMMKLVSQVGGKIRKTHKTYRYLFDRNKEFKREASLLYT